MGSVSEGYQMRILSAPQTKQSSEMQEMMPQIHTFVLGAVLVLATWMGVEIFRQRMGHGGDGTGRSSYKRRKYNSV